MWMDFALGRSTFRLSALINSTNKWIGVCLVIDGPDARSHFSLLHEHKDVIEHEMGTALEWRELPNKKQRRVRLRNSALSPTIREQWPQQHAWLKDTLESFGTVFGPRVKSLNAAAYVPTGFDAPAP